MGYSRSEAARRGRATSAHAPLRAPIDRAVEPIVQERGREAESDEDRDPRRRTEPGRKLSEEPMGVQGAVIVGAFDLEEWQQNHRGCGEQEEHRPGPAVHGVERSGESARTLGSRLAARDERREPHGDDPVLRRPQDEEDERRPGVERHGDHPRKTHDVRGARQRGAPGRRFDREHADGRRRRGYGAGGTKCSRCRGDPLGIEPRVHPDVDPEDGSCDDLRDHHESAADDQRVGAIEPAESAGPAPAGAQAVEAQDPEVLRRKMVGDEQVVDDDERSHALQACPWQRRVRW